MKKTDDKLTLLKAYINKIVDDMMTLDEIRESLKDFILDDMQGLPKDEILQYIDGICPEILGEQDETVDKS